MYVRLLSEPLRQVGAAHNWLRAHCVDSGAVVELEDDAILPFEDCHELPIPDERVRISALAVRDIIGQRPRTIVAKSGAMDSDDIMVPPCDTDSVQQQEPAAELDQVLELTGR